MTTTKPRIRVLRDGTFERRVATHDGWAWVKVSGDGLNQLGGGVDGPVEASPLEAFSSQDLPASGNSGSGLLGIPDFLRRTDGLSLAERIAQINTRLLI